MFFPGIISGGNNFMEKSGVAKRLLSFLYILLSSLLSIIPSLNIKTLVTGFSEMLKEFSQERKAFSMSLLEDAIQIFMLFNKLSTFTTC